MKEIVILILALKCVESQINGDFWWLNGKVKSINNFNEEPIFEDDDTEIDDPDKIVFRDTDAHYTLPENGLYQQAKRKAFNKNKISDRFTWVKNESISTNQRIPVYEANDKNKNNNSDEFTFKFSDDFLDKNMSSNKISEKYTESTENSSTKKVILDPSDKVTFTFNNKDEDTENICTFINKEDCLRRKGNILEQIKTRNSPNQVGEQTICCVLPLLKSAHEQIYFPDSPRFNKKRIPRSTKIFKENLERTDKPIRRIVTLPIKCGNLKTPTKIVTDYEYDDPNPNWNIQNSDIRKQQNKLTRPTSVYGSEDYDDDYEIFADEVPKPGLTGIYSDSRFTPVWKVPDNTDFVNGAANRFPVIDSRLDTRVTNRLTNRKTKRTKQSTESQTISFHSSPDFKVLRGFKLLNIMHGRNKINRNDKKPTFNDDETSGLDVLFGEIQSETTEESLFGEIQSETTEESDIDDIGDIYSNCGNIFTDSSDEYEDGEIGDVQYGTQPWLALILGRRKTQKNLCHATLIHPRAAFTSASCVYGNRPGDLELYAGVWNLMINQKSQRRSPSLLIHPKYTPGDLKNDIAVLYWTQPLSLNKNIQPACLADFQTSNDCRIVSWGRQSASRATPKWQRTSVAAADECDNILDKYGMQDSDAVLCASTQSKECLAHIGSPVICSSDNRQSALGVVVTKDDCDMIVVPAHDWVQTSLARLRITL